MENNEAQNLSVDNSTIALLNKSEIDMQVATAHRYPRSIKGFRDETLQMVTLNEDIAGSCIYALPRGDETIQGPSARFAEVVASAWGNCRAGARIVDDKGDFVTAQGVFHDLERNVAITYEVQRRIVDKNGRRYKPDMIGVTANAACSVALRNAILKGIPKAFWDDMYQAAKQTIMGDVQTLANRRAAAIKAFMAFGINEAQILAKLEVAGVEDISLEHLVVLRGLLTAIKDGDTTPEQAFDTSAPVSHTKEKETYPEALFKKNLAAWEKLIQETKKTPEEIIKTAESKYRLTEEQKKTILAITRPTDVLTVTYAQIAEQLNNANNIDLLDAAADLINEIADEQQRKELGDLYNLRRLELEGSQS